MSGPQAAPPKPSPPAGRFRPSAARSLANLGATARLIRARRKIRAAVYPMLDWKWPLCLALTLVAISALVLDAPAGAFRGHWPAPVEAVARWMTAIGLGGWYIVPAALALIAVNQVDWTGHRGRRRLALYNATGLAFFVLISAGLSGLIASILKQAIGRARPEHYPDLGAFSFHPFAGNAGLAGFPSGHATVVGAMTAVLILLFPQTRYVVLPVGVWIAFTRVVVGMHYPSDVVAGFCFGYAFAVATAIVFARLGYVFAQDRDRLPVRKRTFRFRL